MKTENLKEGIRLNDLIEKEQKMSADTIGQKCEWIEFAFGNGSSKSCVCDDPKTIEDVRSLIEARHISKIMDLQRKFDAL